MHYRPQITEAELLEKNRIYDDAAGGIWRLAVYEPVHDGWEFTNMGGARLLDLIGARARLTEGSRVLELCSGLGAACHYLAMKFGCHVTGIEMNCRQIEHARNSSNSLGPGFADRVRFIEGNVHEWQPERLYDLVYTLDSLMLVDDLPAVLRKINGALKPGGLALLAEMTSGPEVTEELLEFVWDMDGMVSLPNNQQYEAMLRDVGFTEIGTEDVTGLARNCFSAIAIALQERKDAIIEQAGASSYSSWLQLTDFYCRCFRDKKFTYSLITAQRKENGEVLFH